MTNSVPDSFSMDELKVMLDKAKTKEDESPESTEDDPQRPYGGHTKNELVAAVRDSLEALNEKFGGHPMIEKIMCLESLGALIESQTNIGVEQFKEDETHAGVCFLRDAGKLQAAMTEVIDVEMPHDFATR